MYFSFSVFLFLFFKIILKSTSSFHFCPLKVQCFLPDTILNIEYRSISLLQIVFLDRKKKKTNLQSSIKIRSQSKLGIVSDVSNPYYNIINSRTSYEFKIFQVDTQLWCFVCVYILYNNLSIDHILDYEGFRQSYPFLVLIHTSTRNNVHGVTIIGPA